MALPPSPDLDPYLRRMDAALADADAEITVALGGLVETISARVWMGQVMVEWERDESAGGLLLHPRLVERLAALGGTPKLDGESVGFDVGPQVVRALDAYRLRLGGQLGTSPHLRLTLRFDGPGGAYTGGEEAYVVPGTKRETTLLRLTAQVTPRAPRAVAPA